MDCFFFSWHRNAFVTNVIANVQVHGDKEIRGKVAGIASTLESCECAHTDAQIQMSVTLIFEKIYRLIFGICFRLLTNLFLNISPPPCLK